MRGLFSVTLFLSAALLFLVEPMFAKMVLPRFGGTPAVWNTCMVFFQAALLAGYAYAHGLARWRPRWQVAVHLALLSAPVWVLPIALPAQGVSSPEANPIPALLALLAIGVGLPFFAISASAPVFQKWFSRLDDPAAKDPYFLYAASNIGSMLGLLSYPVLLEPHLTLATQSRVWMVGYCALLALAAMCGAAAWRAGAAPVQAQVVPLPAVRSARPRWTRRLRWVLLACVPSSLLLGLTTYLTTDVASVPLLWVIPLAIYLLSFILVFGRWPEKAHTWMVRLFPWVMSALLVYLLVETRTTSLFLTLPLLALNTLVFFVAALVCHGELARDRPAPEHLTEFYLWLSLGGVLGGVFNALVAPVVFKSVVEYPIALALACLLVPSRPAAAAPERSLWRRLKNRLTPADVGWPLLLGVFFMAIRFVLNKRAPSLPVHVICAGVLPALLCLLLARRPLRYGLGVTVLLAVAVLQPGLRTHTLHTARSFFGVYRVQTSEEGDFHSLYHGSTVHGVQSMRPEQRHIPCAYYYPTGPIGQVFRRFSGPEMKRNVGLLGLGCGTLAAYANSGQNFTYYEIDPLVRWIARDSGYFTYLKDAETRGAQVAIVMGDARLSLQSAPPRAYDLLVVDVFSSDSVPVHLLTREAWQVYLDKLAPSGLLACNISSRYLRLEPVLRDLAADAHLICFSQLDTEVTAGEDKDGKFASHWVLMARGLADFGGLPDDRRWKRLPAPAAPDPWTDGFSNIFAVIDWSRLR